MAATVGEDSFLSEELKNSVEDSLDSSIEETRKTKEELKPTKGPKAKNIGHYMLGRQVSTQAAHLEKARSARSSSALTF